MSAAFLDAGFLPIATLRGLVMPAGVASETDWDADLQSLGKGTAELFNSYCNRTLQRGTGLIYECPAQRTSLVVPAYPLEQVTAALLVYDDQTEDILEDILNTFADAGLVEFGYNLGNHKDLVRVTYDGGYWLNDGGSQPAGTTELPADLLDAWITQMTATIKARRLFWDSSLGDPDTEEGASLGNLQLIPLVQQTLDKYRRFS